MDLLFLDAAFSICSSPIDDYTSAVWKLKWDADDECSVELPVRHLSEALAATFIYNPDANSTMIITMVAYTREKITISGVGLTAMLNWRAVAGSDETYAADTPAASSAAALINSNISGARSLYGMQIINSAGEGKLTDEIKVSQGAKLGESVRSLLKPCEYGLRCVWLDSEGALKLIIKEGLDRTQDQSVNGFALFSSSFGNLKSFSYSKSFSGWANYALNASGSLDRSLNDPRREVWVSDAGDFAKTLDDSEPVISGQAETDDVSGFRFGVDYDLGDLADVRDEQSGLEMSARIIQIDLVYEGGRRRVIPTIGDGKPTIASIIKKIAKG